MKKQLLLFALSFLAISTAFAQGRSQRGGNGQATIERMAEQLELNEEQVERLTAYRATYADEMRAAMSEASNREEKRAVSQEFRDAWRAELEAVLTADQLAKLDEQQATRRERRAERPERNRERRQARVQNFQAQVQAMARELELSDEQINSLQSYLDEQKESRQTELEAAEGREEKAALLRTYAEEFDQELQATLSPEQYEQYQTMKAERQETRESRRGGEGRLRRSDRG